MDGAVRHPSMLRLLHTSDWHLGQFLRDRDRCFEHEQFLSWLRQTIVERNVDALLLAGDVFDVANPPAHAQRQFYEFIATVKAAQPRLRIVIVAGNHDSPSRLEAPNSLLDALGAKVVGRVHWSRVGADGESAPALEDLVVPLQDASGRTAAYCLAVPFLRPGDVPTVDEGDAYARGVEELYRRLTERVLAVREPGQAIVAMGHATVLGTRERTKASVGAVHAAEMPSELGGLATLVNDGECEAADQEEFDNDAIRPILLGGLGHLHDRLFADECAYVALGHLHRAARVGGKEHVRYSGSPIPLSFAERNYRHQVVYVEIDGERATCVEPLFVPRAVHMLRIPNAPASLTDALAALNAWCPTSEELERPVWLEVAIGDDERRIFDLVSRIDEALRGKPVRAWRLSEARTARDTHERGDRLTASSLDEVKRTLDPEWLLVEAWRRANAKSPIRPDLLECLRELTSTDGGA